MGTLKKIRLSGLILASLLTFSASAQDNFFFPLHNIIRGDSVYNTYDKQVALIKKTGYDGLEINQVSSFDGMKAALDKHKFPGAFFYVQVKLEEPYFEPELQDCIRRLKGSNTIISPYILAVKDKFPPSSRDADQLAVRLISQLSDWAAASGLQVAIYPHINFYVERANHAADLAKMVNRENVGLTFNLCHWLATTGPQDRENLYSDLSAMRPYLKMITINGANNTVSNKKNVWEDYIMPLGTGTFDTYGLVKYLIKDLRFQGLVGVQCYDIKSSKPELVKNTIKVWKSYKKQLKSVK